MVYTTKKCTVCNTTKPIELFTVNRLYHDGHTTVCKECRNKKTRDRYGNDVEYREKIRERNKIASEKYRKKEGFISWRNRSNENLEKHREAGRKRIKINKYEALFHYSNGELKCACCGESHFDFLTIDHINGGGYKHKKENKLAGNNFYVWLRNNCYPEGYQVLCMNCNWSKRLNNGKCIHKIESEVFK